MIRAVLLLSLWGLPAAAGSFAMPEGCAGRVTVQSRDCSVTQIYTCEAEPGYSFRADFSDEGHVFSNTVDAETRWIFSDHIQSGHQDYLSDEPDPASFSALIETGRDAFDFWTESPQLGRTHYTGFDELTGKRREIAGVELLETAFEMRVEAEDGTFLWQITGREYVVPDWRVFLGGTREIVTPDDTYSEDGSPVQFAFPGEPGFLATTPMFGCGQMLARAALTPASAPAPARY